MAGSTTENNFRRLMQPKTVNIIQLGPCTYIYSLDFDPRKNYKALQTNLAAI